MLPASARSLRAPCAARSSPTWRNAARFDQLCDRMASGDVVPFIGARLSAPDGFPTWKDHLRQQGRTAGMAAATVEGMLTQGLYEEIVDQIEQQSGDDVFA
jgi:hypothetical protein